MKGTQGFAGGKWLRRPTCLSEKPKFLTAARMLGSSDLAVHQRYLSLKQSEKVESPQHCTRMTAARQHPLDLHIMQVVLEEVLEKGKLRLVDAGRHCEGRDFGLLPLHVLWRRPTAMKALQTGESFAPTCSNARAACLKLGGDLLYCLKGSGLGSGRTWNAFFISNTSCSNHLFPADSCQETAMHACMHACMHPCMCACVTHACI